MKLYVIVTDKGRVATKLTDNKLGVFVRRDLAKKHLHLYNGNKIVEVDLVENNN